MSYGVKLGTMSSFEFNPQGNIWSNNENRLGFKLLSKMGWSKGKGLGKNESGIKEHIKVAKKDSKTGVGWKKGIPIPKGCIEYDNVLSKLQQHFKPNKNGMKLQSTDSKEIVRNKKKYFSGKGREPIKIPEKDLEKGLKCIFLGKLVEEENDEEEKVSPTFKSNLSIQDYFGMKMKKKSDVTSISEIEKGSGEYDSNFISKNPSKKRKYSNDCFEEVKRPKVEYNEEVDPVSENYKNFDNTGTGKHKHKKSKKKKSHKVKELKSCIKADSLLNLNEEKNVSFNDSVSCKMFHKNKIINDSTEEEIVHKVEINGDSTEEEMVHKVEINGDSSEEEMIHEVELNGDSTEDEIIHADEVSNTCKDENSSNKSEIKKEVSSSSEDEIEEDNQAPACLNLPKCSASNFNFWLESQRAAMKMKLYQGMFVKMKQDPVMRTTNLLDIKGYGNWGL